MQKQKSVSTLTGIVAIIIVAVILFGGVFAYQYFLIQKSQQAKNAQPVDQTAGWKTYTNAQYGFEVKYPADGSVQTGDDSESRAGDNFAVINLWTAPGGAIHPESKEMYVHVDEAVGMHPCGDPFKNPAGTITEKLTAVHLNGTEFTKGDVSPYRDLGLKLADEYCTVRNGNRYQIIAGQYTFGGTGLNPSVGPGLESDTLINQAISTFKFTK